MTATQPPITQVQVEQEENATMQDASFIESTPSASDAMPNADQKLVSCVANGTSTATKHYDPKEIIDSIRADKHFKLREPIEKIRMRFAGVMARTRNDRRAAKEAVKNRKFGLPAVLWSGTFRNRKAADPAKLLQYSGLLCADLDELGEGLPEIREILRSRPYVWALFTSPTGDGLKCVFCVLPDAEKHTANFRAVEQYVRQICGVQIDQACSDVARLCVLSHDPNAYFNENAIELPPVVEETATSNSADSAAPSELQLSKLQKIASEILGDIDWKSEIEGFCPCPAQRQHTTGEGAKDCRVKLDGVPTIYCFHDHCRALIEGANYVLRSRIAKNGSAKPAPLVRPLVELVPADIDDGNMLLGYRFLCRGGGLLVVGAAGIGKSTLVIQLAICWAVGRDCFGIKPAKPVKILYVQAENDEGDLCEMRDGVVTHLDLADEEEAHLRDNFVCVFECCRTGSELIEALERLCETHSPDLVILDPALSYIGGDANQQEIVGGFLRNHLNPLLQRHRCGALIVHHTPKAKSDGDRKNKVATDFAYAGTGSAEWANWPRAVLVLSTKDDNGLRELRIGKRFRLGWTDANGKPVVAKLLRQNSDGGSLFYRELSASETMLESNQTPPTQKVLRAGILPEPGGSVEKKILAARIANVTPKICGRDRALEEVIPWLIDQGYLEEKEVPRPGARAAIHLVRTSERPNVIYMTPAVEPVSTDEVITEKNAS